MSQQKKIKIVEIDSLSPAIQIPQQFPPQQLPTQQPPPQQPKMLHKAIKQQKQLVFQKFKDLFDKNKFPFDQQNNVVVSFAETTLTIHLNGLENEVLTLEQMIIKEQQQLEQQIKVQKLQYNDKDIKYLQEKCQDKLKQLQQSEQCLLEIQQQIVSTKTLHIVAQATFQQKKLFVVQGSIGDLKADVIVNQCGPKLCLSTPQSNIEKAIQDTFGQFYINFCIDYIKTNTELKVGQVGVYQVQTQQQAKYVYNIARPSSQNEEVLTIQKNMDQIFKQAKQDKVSSIGLPIIGATTFQSSFSNLIKVMMSQALKQLANSDLAILYIVDMNQKRIQEIVNTLINLNSQSTSVYQWFWEESGNHFEYNNVENNKVDKAYQEYLQDSSKNIFQFSMQKNNVNIVYEIDFSQNPITQINTQTNYSRNVTFKQNLQQQQQPQQQQQQQQQQIDPNYQWSWEESGKYTNYDDSSNQIIDQGYNIFQNDSSKSIINLTIKNQQYQIIFNQNSIQQKNCQTNFMRNLQYKPYINFQWQWEDQTNVFKNYDHDVNLLIDRAYQDYLQDANKNQLTLSLNSQNKVIQYYIQFEQNSTKQINTNTNYERKVKYVPYQQQQQLQQQQQQQSGQIEYKYNVQSIQEKIENHKTQLQLQLSYITNQNLQAVIDQLNQFVQENRNEFYHIIPAKLTNQQLTAYQNLINQFAINQISNFKSGDSVQIIVYKEDNKSLIQLLQHLQEHHSDQILQQLKTVEQAKKTKYPKHWCNQQQSFLKVLLKNDSEEFKKIQAEFNKTSTGQVHRIYRIQNKTFYKLYKIEQNHLFDQVKERKEQLSQLETERYLWHGVKGQHPKVIYESIKNTFDASYANTGLWGPGIYFAENASYSKDYSFTLPASSENDSDLAGKLVFLCCLVCTGKLYSSNPDNTLKRPPDGYDAVTGFTNGSNVFILYQMNVRRAYPAYEVIYE